MTLSQQMFFDSFRLDEGQYLYRGDQVVPLRPKALAVLAYLVDRAGELVTKEDLLEAVWPGTTLSDGVLKESIRQIRKALEDTAKEPRFIATMNRQGYRFIAAVRALDRPLTFHQSLLVDRQKELAQLHQWLTKALQGERQVGFISGVAGIGKTTLVDTFVARASTKETLWIGHGQCHEHYGAGEAYLPLLVAFGRLGREAGGGRLIDVLKQQAPSWLVQMPTLLPAAAFEALQRRESRATRERMMRELAEAVEILTQERPLVLVLEDLHWSDVATLDWLAFVAKRSDYARLLVLGTYRPVEAIVGDHPLRAVMRELQVHGQCVEQVLEYLSEAGVAEYLTQRLEGNLWPTDLARLIYQRTHGNPFFMVHIVNELIAQNLLNTANGVCFSKIQTHLETTVPENVQQMITLQFERLSLDEQRILEVASVAGMEFAVDEVAEALDTDERYVDACCARLARHRIFLRVGEVETWPEGITKIRYGFIHALYHDVLYDRIAPGQRIHLHQRIGTRKEATYGKRTREIAAELAIHFERGHDYRRAVQYRIQAAETAGLRSAYQEAINHLKHALQLLEKLPDTSQKTEQAIALNLHLGRSLALTQGHAAPAVKDAYAQAQELCQPLGEASQFPEVVWGLWLHHNFRGELADADECGQSLLSILQDRQDTRLLPAAFLALGITSLFQGEFGRSQAYCEQSLSLSVTEKQRASVPSFDMSDQRVSNYSSLALALWFRGSPDRAKTCVDEARRQAERPVHLPSRAVALSYQAIVHHLCGEGQTVWERAEEVITLANEQGLILWSAIGTMLRGWALAVQQDRNHEGLELLHQGFHTWQMTGARLAQPYWLALLAEAYGHAGDIRAGQGVLEEALTIAESTGQWFYTAELFRLQGELFLRQNPRSETQAEACFQQALTISQQQQAKSLELRTAVSLSRLWQQQNKHQEAYDLLALVYEWFTEGFDTADLIDAKALLDELS